MKALEKYQYQGCLFLVKGLLGYTSLISLICVPFELIAPK